MDERSQKKILTDRPDTLVYLAGHALKLVVQCLEPRDVLKCIQTCQQWKRDIDEEVWTEVAKNTFPVAVSAIEAADVGDNNPLDYRSIVLGLSRKSYNPYSKMVWPLPKPRLRLEDVLVVFEIREKDSKRRLGAWSSTLREEGPHGAFGDSDGLNDDESRNSDNPFEYFVLGGKSIKTDTFKTVSVTSTSREILDLLDGQNDDPGSKFDVPEQVYKKLEIKLCLIRLDAGNGMCGKSVCLTNYEQVELVVKGGVAYYNIPLDLAPDETNESINIVRTLCLQRYINLAQAVVAMQMELILEDLNKKERIWLEKARCHSLIENDRDGILLEFEYSFSHFAFTFEVIGQYKDNPPDSFWSMDDLLLFLDGLNWK